MTDKVRVYKTQLAGSPPIGWDDVNDVVLEVHALLPEMQLDDSFEITVVEVEQEEWDRIMAGPEWPGY